VHDTERPPELIFALIPNDLHAPMLPQADASRSRDSSQVLVITIGGL
jgi:hypothetical protein